MGDRESREEDRRIERLIEEREHEQFIREHTLSKGPPTGDGPDPCWYIPVRK